VSQHEGQFVTLRARIDRHEDGADERGGDHCLDELRVVAHHDREAVTFAHPLPEQIGGDAMAVVAQLRIAAYFVRRPATVETEVLERQDVAIRLLPGADLDQVGQPQFVARIHGGTRFSAPAR
jgi:hypothetical protein